MTEESSSIQVKRVCYCCGTDKSRRNHRYNRLLWIHNYDSDDNVLCMKCYDHLVKSRFYYEKDREKILKQHKDSKARHKDAIRLRSQRYREKNRERIRIASTVYYQKTAAKVRIERKGLQQKLFEILGQDSCARCGYSDPRALQFDHIQGGGMKELNTAFHRNHYGRRRYYIANPDIARKALQVLCANCNWIKVFENKENFSKYI
jgi:hypothetical protein